MLLESGETLVVWNDNKRKREIRCISERKWSETRSGSKMLLESGEILVVWNDNKHAALHSSAMLIGEDWEGVCDVSTHVV